MKKKKYLHAFTAGIILFCGFLFSGISVSAKEKELIEPSSRLEWDFTDDLLPLDDDDPFLYGNTTLGQFQIHGGIQARTLYEGVDAFVVNGPITLEYTCDNSFQAGEGTKWELLKPDSKDEKNTNLISIQIRGKRNIPGLKVK